MQTDRSAGHASFDELSERLAFLERRHRRLSQAFAAVAITAVLALFGAIELHSPATASEGTADPGVVTVRQLAIVDDNGIVRARVGADLPDAIINGKRIGRGGEKVSGIMLYDGTGQERGGYVTFEPSGNIGLTLDSRKAQTALFIADADGGSALQLWTRNGSIELRSDEDGSRLTGTRSGTIVQQVPPIAMMSGGTCLAYKEALTRVSPMQVASDCRRRFPGEACDKCLGPAPPAQ